MLEQTEQTTIVFVTNQKRCVNLIKIGQKISRTAKTRLVVANITPVGVSEMDAQALDYLFEQTKRRGAEMKVVYSNNPFEEMKELIVQFNAKHIVTGRPAGDTSVVYKIQRAFADKIFYAVVPETEEYAARTGRLKDHVVKLQAAEG